MKNKRKLTTVLNSFKSQKIEKQVQKKKQKSHSYRFKPQYSLEDTILLVGEGNFSFSLALAEQLTSGHGMVCTSYDTELIVKEKYPESVEILEALNDYESQVLYGIDATKLDKHAIIRKNRFSKIIFNFPHVGLGIKDQDRNIKANQELILDFLASASTLLQSKRYGDEFEGEIYITLKTGLPYDLWEVKSLAKSCGLITVRSFEFNPNDYPGYEHRRTIGFEEHISARGNAEITKNPPKSFVFSLKPEEE